MKVFIYLLAICFLFFLSITDTLAQNSEAVKKDLSIELGGTYLNYDLWSIVPNDKALGAYLKLEKIWDKNFGFYVSYSLTIFDLGEYTRTSMTGEEIGRAESTNYFQSLNLGANWYVISSDIATRFTPYIGASVRITYSYNNTEPTSGNMKEEIPSLSALDFAFVPNAGLNIPVSSALGIRVEGKYRFSLFDIEIEERVKRNWEYYAFSLGLKYSF